MESMKTGAVNGVPVIFVLDDFERFACRRPQTLLYALLDLCQVCVALVGNILGKHATDSEPIFYPFLQKLNGNAYFCQLCGDLYSPSSTRRSEIVSSPVPSAWPFFCLSFPYEFFSAACRKQ